MVMVLEMEVAGKFAAQTNIDDPHHPTNQPSKNALHLLSHLSPRKSSN
jgi:hypothetical protein